MKRVYVRSTYLGLTDAQFEIPEWNSGQSFVVELRYIPSSIRAVLHSGFACYVDINENAEESRHLQLHNWSLHSEV